MAADRITDEWAARAGVAGPVAGFSPSPRRNLDECYRTLGDLARAREHLWRGQAAAGALGDDDYGRLVRGTLDRRAARLTTG